MRIDDGTLYFGRLGELAYDADEDKVQCHLCGGWYRAIGSTHLRRAHGWTLADYRDAFRLPMQQASCARGTSQRLSANALKLIEKGQFGKGAGVPVEARAVRVRPWRTLAAVHPELVRQLDPARNDGLDASAIAAGSGRKLWWRCQDCGHSWQATVGSRSAGHGCPACYSERRRRQGPRAAQAGRSLAALHPEIAAEWDAAGNRELDPAAISPGSGWTVWWRCGACGHRWQTSVDNRTSGHGCPSCAVRRRAWVRSRVDYERSLAALHPVLVAELHVARNPGVDPAQLGARSSLRVWWRCITCGHEWRTAVSTRTNGSGCPVCGLKRRARTQSKVPRARSLAVKDPRVAGQLHPTRNPGIDPSQLGARSHLKLWWRCEVCGHEWRTAVSTRTDGSGCPACARAARAGGPAARGRAAGARLAGGSRIGRRRNRSAVRPRST